MTQEKLTSIKLQHMLNINNLGLDLFRPVLSFGKKKSGKYNFPIVFKDYKQAENIYDELSKLKGKGIDEVRKESEKLYKKYKKFQYK